MAVLARGLVESNGRLSVCALVPYPVGTTPSQRFRIEQWGPQLEAERISLELRPFLRPRDLELLYRSGQSLGKAVMLMQATLRRAAEIASLANFDAVLVHRAACLAGPAILERRIARRNALVFDFDDAIYLLDTTAANRSFGWLKFPGKTAVLCRMSRHVVAGNTHLASYARRYNSSVTVIPSSIDTDRYHPRPSRRSTGRVVVGWMGSSTSQSQLETFAPVLRRLARMRDIEVRVVSDRQPTLPGVPATWRHWTAEREVEDLAEFDVGIMPMQDDEWTRGKCAMKALQYMGMAVPVVCSAVGANLEVVRHAENGFLAGTPGEWVENLVALVDDTSLRERLGSAGRRTVEDAYSMRSSARGLARVLRRAVAGEEAAVAA